MAQTRQPTQTKIDRKTELTQLVCIKNFLVQCFKLKCNKSFKTCKNCIVQIKTGAERASALELNFTLQQSFWHIKNFLGVTSLSSKREFLAEQSFVVEFMRYVTRI